MTSHLRPTLNRSEILAISDIISVFGSDYFLILYNIFDNININKMMHCAIFFFITDEDKVPLFEQYISVLFTS